MAASATAMFETVPPTWNVRALTSYWFHNRLRCINSTASLSAPYGPKTSCSHLTLHKCHVCFHNTERISTVSMAVASRFFWKQISSVISLPASKNHFVVDRINHIVYVYPTQNALRKRLPQYLPGVFWHLLPDRVNYRNLRLQSHLEIRLPAGQVTGIRRFQCGIGQTFPGTVSRDKVFDYVQSFLKIKESIQGFQ